MNNAAIGGVESLPIENPAEVTYMLRYVFSDFSARRPQSELIYTCWCVEQIKGMDAFQMAEWMWKQSRPTSDAAKAGIQTNYYGMKNVTEALLPLLQASSDGRVVNVSSDFGLLRVSFSDFSSHKPLQSRVRLLDLTETGRSIHQSFQCSISGARS